MSIQITLPQDSLGEFRRQHHKQSSVRRYALTSTQQRCNMPKDDTTALFGACHSIHSVLSWYYDPVIQKQGH